MTAGDWKNGQGLGWQWSRRPMMAHALPLTLVGHYGAADMDTFWYDGEPYRVDFLRKLMSVGGGKVISGEYPSTSCLATPKRPSRASATTRSG